MLITFTNFQLNNLSGCPFQLRMLVPERTRYQNFSHWLIFDNHDVRFLNKKKLKFWKKNIEIYLGTFLPKMSFLAWNLVHFLS